MPGQQAKLLPDVLTRMVPKLPVGAIMQGDITDH
jgi:hypothetical protein